jgi:uncharacterized membrane-anchored protein
MSRSDPTALTMTAMLNKVPEVTLIFWIIKIMATTVGETAADFLNVRLNLGLNGTSLVMSGALLVALLVQLRARRYVPWMYWVTVVFVSVVGTLITDNLTDNLGISLFVTAAVFSVALAATFATWQASEGTLSVHTIVTTKRELFYWAAILLTFALGTASGDLLAEKLQLGYGLSALIVGALIAAVYAAYRLFALNAVLAFWIAYVLTRPLGASFGDLLSQPAVNGGMGLGTVLTSFIFLSVIALLIVVLTLRPQAPGAQPEV